MGMYARGMRYIGRFGALDSFRKIIYLLLRFPNSILQFFRSVRFYFYTRCWVQHIRGKIFIQGLGNDIVIGKDATLYPGITLEIDQRAKLHIGDHFTLSYGALVACNKCILIGDYVMIGEYTSIRDTTHSYDNTSFPYCYQPDQQDNITIGNNVWIGRGCVILPGTIIEDGVIIGANSVVKGHLQAYGLFAGSPARFLKMVREPAELIQALQLQAGKLNKPLSAE
ncbi:MULTISPECIES: acyltransferase [Niastella]|uniref:Acyltransferase n=1 Tax=Niastella soli TaxID=2821487 RepID=A0ABS3YQN5_9BACT|nr:acyltransferase [Niastella soli]MBO9200154.1 acyltransferase [Niastella soli]